MFHFFSRLFVPIFLLFLIFAEGNLLANGLYEEGYEMEQTNTLFAIPLYEQALTQKPTGKLQKAIVTRLFFLYKKHGKILDGLFLNSRYSSFIASKEKNWIWSQLADFYKPIPLKDLSTTYVLCLKTNVENSNELQEWLLSQSNPKLLEFASILLIKRKQFSVLKLILSEFPEAPISPLYLGLTSLKSKEETSKEYLKELIADETKFQKYTADVLYLMGLYYRLMEEWNLSARYFRMSGSYGAKERSIVEASKSIVEQGSSREICTTFKFSQSPNDEIWTLLYFHCHSNRETLISPIKKSISLLAKKEGNEFLKRLFFGTSE